MEADSYQGYTASQPQPVSFDRGIGNVDDAPLQRWGRRVRSAMRASNIKQANRVASSTWSHMISFQAIELEHARLEEMLSALSQACPRFHTPENCDKCGREKSSSCRGRLVSFAHEFLELVIEYFEYEESLLSDLFDNHEPAYGKSQFHQHNVREVRALEDSIRNFAAQGRLAHVSVAIRDLYACATHMFNRHTQAVDEIFRQAGCSRPYS